MWWIQQTFTWYQSPFDLTTLILSSLWLPNLLIIFFHMITIKLSSSNYLLWKSQLLPLLESQDMLGYVDGTMVPPPRFELETSSRLDPKYLVWRVADQRLLCLLLFSLNIYE